ncbi:hypothetical protein [Lewinella sp. 4G2]|uniref:hypothetical protein n=1 Tax=Lewinella sp. 4G2 TaxID=1803372 RepID=UPI0007B4ADEE|nr:hypothetical protein [Lewinella sp. 4G2]OAV45140.1 hypothetical protein A3850_011850 [Lewinella sp. 4G2]
MSVKNWKDYLLQVSLIIVSLFIAFGVNRCGDRARDNNKLEIYQDAITEEIAYEIDATQSNIADALNDLEDLGTGIDLLRNKNPESLPQALEAIGTVLQRGVFRGFEPMVYEQMSAAGDLLLIEDLEYRSSLASLSAFRRDYVQQDLARHDAITLETIAEIAEYVDLMCLRSVEPSNMRQCLPDPERLYREMGSDLAKLTRHAELRAFHLNLYLKSLQNMEKRIE